MEGRKVLLNPHPPKKKGKFRILDRIDPNECQQYLAETSFYGLPQPYDWQQPIFQLRAALTNLLR
jgi:hypothetical protein